MLTCISLTMKTDVELQAGGDDMTSAQHIKHQGPTISYALLKNYSFKKYENKLRKLNLLNSSALKTPFAP